MSSGPSTAWGMHPVVLMVSIKTAFRRGVVGEIAEVEAVKICALPSLMITGLVGDIVRESRERVLGCLATLGFSDILSGRVVVHLSPAAEKKQGSHFDLAIALAVLAVEGKLPDRSLWQWAALGELALDGRIRKIESATVLIETLARDPNAKVIAPIANALQAGMVGRNNVWLSHSLSDVISHLQTGATLSRANPTDWRAPVRDKDPFRDVRGQALAKRALQIAVAGRHHLLMVGSPGVGKSLLASAAAGLQPALTKEEYLETSRIHDRDEWTDRPFRSPHHSISASAFLGGGTGCIVPGEVSLAHRGILFLDEFPEFRRDAIEGLREPLETGKIHLHRTGKWFCLPAKFTMIAAMNPCPCGFSMESSNRCRCSHERRLAYGRRISGPILDRMDMTVVLDSSSLDDDANTRRYAIAEATERQASRYADIPTVERNGDIPWGENWERLKIPGDSEQRLRKLSSGCSLSLRAIHKILRVARTISDLDGSDCVLHDHLHEAWDLRCRTSSIYWTTPSAN